jgi:hypothetical protein
MLGDRGDVGRLASPSLTRGTVVRGGAGPDYLSGGELLDGGPGNDELNIGYDAATGVRLHGGAGRDSITGGNGPDLIKPGPGRDEVSAWRGADRIRARDGAFDTIRCGRGADRLWLDGIDLAFGSQCERIARRGAPRAIPYGTWVDVEDPLEAQVACPSDIVGGRCLGTVRLTLRSGRRVGGARLNFEAGQTGTVDVWPTGPVHRRIVRTTVRTLRHNRSPISMTRSDYIEYSSGDG